MKAIEINHPQFQHAFRASRIAGKALSLLGNVFIVNPAVLGTVLVVVLMAYQGVGPTKYAETIIEDIAALAALGPAREGYLNLSVCTDPSKDEWLDNEPLMPPFICQQYTTEVVPIPALAEKVTYGIGYVYLVLVLLGLALRFLISPRGWLWPSS